MDKYFFYDHEEVDKLRSERDSKLMDLYRKYYKAKEKGNIATSKRAIASISKCKKETERYKEMAKDAGYYWY